MKNQLKQILACNLLAAMILSLLGASMATAALPDPGMQIDPANTALLAK